MLSGKASEKPGFLSGRNAVVWSRHYSAASTDCCDCEQLAEVLGRLPGAARMVVGHTIQEAGISSACGGKVLRIDVGLSRGCGNGSPEVRPGQNSNSASDWSGGWADAAVAALPVQCQRSAWLWWIHWDTACALTSLLQRGSLRVQSPSTCPLILLPC